MWTFSSISYRSNNDVSLTKPKAKGITIYKDPKMPGTALDAGDVALEELRYTKHMGII